MTSFDGWSPARCRGPCRVEYTNECRTWPTGFNVEIQDPRNGGRTMSRLTNLALAMSAGSMAIIGLQAAPAGAGTTAVHQSKIVGQLGYEGGAAPGGFHPTAGTVEVEFNSPPLVLLKHVGKSGNFTIKLSPGSY